MSKRFYVEGLPGVAPEELGGWLIVIEGADGSGRSTQIGLLKNWLEQQGHACVDVGLKRSELVAPELEDAKQGNVLSPITLSLFYATDFADQLENRILPALRSGFVVLADRYIYTLMARDIVRGADRAWIESVYGIALIPDAVFYLKVSPQELARRTLEKTGTLDYWESGMDLHLSRSIYDCFLAYQRRMQQEYERMRASYGFEVLPGQRSPRSIQRELRTRIGPLLERSA